MAEPTIDAISTWVNELEQHGIRYVRFEFPDLHGTSRLKVVPIAKVESYARKGLNFYGGTLALDTASSVVPNSGFHEERKYRDHMIVPDLASWSFVPWMDDTAKVICDAYWSPEEPVTGAPRYVLKTLLDIADQMGFSVMMGHEFEFYLLDPETKKPLFDGLHIFNHTRNQFVPELTDMLDYLQAAGIDVITHNCEYAPSQFEINYGPGVGIAGADKAFTFKTSVKEIAHHLGYLASFMSKPFAGMAGCCCHFHLSLWDKESGTNAFLDGDRPHGLSETADFFIQGILDHAPAMMPLIGPTPNCYRRLKPHTFAPSNISWGVEDRTAMVRVKATYDDATHLEMRAASGLSNPYLSAAATLAAGLLGLKDKRSLQPMSEGPSEDDPSFTKFPQTLDAALAAFKTDAAMTSMLGSEFCHLFTTVKSYELSRFFDHITDWEVSEYLEVY